MTTEANRAGAAALTRPLEGFRVLDLTVALAGPYCTLLLAGMGAEVIKIESPRGNDVARTNPPFYGPDGFKFDNHQAQDVSLSMLARGRNKKSISLDLKSEEGRALFMQLARQADVVVENMSDGTAERLGVGYEAVRGANERIVYASISGLGDPSPFPGLKVVDIIVQALSGIMSLTGAPDGPPTRVGASIGDLVAPIFACNGILAALLQRSCTGTGQHVKVAMVDALASLLAADHFDVFQREGISPRTGNFMHRNAPFGVFEAADGYVAIAANNDTSAYALFAEMGHPEMKDDPRFQRKAGRVANMKLLNAMIEDWTRVRSSQDLMDLLYRARGIPCVRLRGIDEVLQDPVLHARGAIQRLSHPDLGEIDAVGMGLPISFSGAKSGFDQPARALGADNAAIYGELLGLDGAEFDDLRQRGVI